MARTYGAAGPGAAGAATPFSSWIFSDPAYPSFSEDVPTVLLGAANGAHLEPPEGLVKVQLRDGTSRWTAVEHQQTRTSG